MECAACLDALAAKTLVTKARIAEGKALLLRIVGMLTKLVERFDAYRARENKEGLIPIVLVLRSRRRPRFQG